MDDDEVVSHPNKNSQSKTKNVVITIIVMIGLFIGIGVWYNNTHYNSTFQNNFMNGCEGQGGSASGCACAYGVLQSEYDYSEAKAINADPSSPDGQALASSVSSQCGSSQ
jgi:hypothetical protein